MAADGHLGMMALSRVTLAAAGLSCCLRYAAENPAHFDVRSA